MPIGNTPSSQIMDLHGQALLDYFKGDREATIFLHRDDGFTYPPLPARYWFYEDGISNLDRIALSMCQGNVLDIGASSGSHALSLQTAGLDVVALELSLSAVEVMRRRGVQKVVLGDVFTRLPCRFDSILLLTNIGVVQNLAGLERFFVHIKSVLQPGGRLITDSIDPRNNDDVLYGAYRKAKVVNGGYEGERTLCFEYKGQRSPWFEWMHIDFDTLVNHAAQSGFSCTLLGQEGRRFLCQLELFQS